MIFIFRFSCRFFSGPFAHALPSRRPLPPHAGSFTDNIYQWFLNGFHSKVFHPIRSRKYRPHGHENSPQIQSKAYESRQLFSLLFLSKSELVIMQGMFIKVRGRWTIETSVHMSQILFLPSFNTWESRDDINYNNININDNLQNPYGSPEWGQLICDWRQTVIVKNIGRKCSLANETH